MAAALQLLKSISRRRRERHDLEMQMLVTQKSESILMASKNMNISWLFECKSLQS